MTWPPLGGERVRGKRPSQEVGASVPKRGESGRRETKRRCRRNGVQEVGLTGLMEREEPRVIFRSGLEWQGGCDSVT